MNTLRRRFGCNHIQSSEDCLTKEGGGLDGGGVLMNMGGGGGGGLRVLTITIGDRIGPDKLHASGGYVGEVSVTL